MYQSLLSLLLFVGSSLSSPVSSPQAAAAAEYDYIVVGSGPGGGPLAANLARKNYTVLLLEAGDQSPGPGSDSYPPTLTWDFFVRNHADEQLHRKFNHLVWRQTDGRYWVGRDNPPSGAQLLGIYYPRGATVGGSSMINAMVNWLPSDSDWNYHVNLTGDDSWSADNMRKIFMRIEHNNYLSRGAAGHGFDGYYQTTLDKTTGLQNPLLNVGQAIASAIGKDPNQVNQMVQADPNYLDPQRDFQQGMWGLSRHAKADGSRYSSRDYIVDTINAKYPLTLQMTTLATRVLFSNSSSCGDKPQATGVEFIQGQSMYGADPRFSNATKGTVGQATAKKEVILAGGAFNTPQLLMLSGIGPRDQLEKFNIPVRVESPGVGNSLMDNQEMPIVGQYAGGSGGFGNNGYVMLKTNHSTDGERDVWLMQGTFALRGFWPTNQTNPNINTEPPNTFAFSLVKNHPQNRNGTVRLRSSNPQDPPDINFNIYTEGKEADMGAMKDTVAWARKVWGATKAPAGPVKPTEPTCKGTVDANGSCGQDDEDWIMQQTWGHHPTSTARIGADDDKMAVLDGNFKVRGTAGLRVVDASAFARIPGIYPVVATFMLSEKGSDTVLAAADGDHC